MTEMAGPARKELPRTLQTRIRATGAQMSTQSDSRHPPKQRGLAKQADHILRTEIIVKGKVKLVTTCKRLFVCYPRANPGKYSSSEDAVAIW